MITWTKIQKGQKLPVGEVLATNEGGEYLVGYLVDTARYGIVCDEGNTRLEDCTHYSLLNTPKEAQ